MRFSEPPRGKGGPAPAAPLSLPLLAGAAPNCTPCPRVPVGKGLEAALAAGEKQTELRRAFLLRLAAALDVQPGFGVRSLLSSEHGSAQPGPRLDRDDFLPAVVAPAAAALPISVCQGVSGTLTENGHSQPFPAVLRPRLQPFGSSCWPVRAGDAPQGIPTSKPCLLVMLGGRGQALGANITSTERKWGESSLQGGR